MPWPACRRFHAHERSAGRLGRQVAGPRGLAADGRGRRVMGTYPDAPGHRNVETSIAAADALAPKLGRLQRMAEGAIRDAGAHGLTARSEEHTSELQSLMRISYAVFCLKKKK